MSKRLKLDDELSSEMKLYHQIDGHPSDSSSSSPTPSSSSSSSSSSPIPSPPSSPPLSSLSGQKVYLSWCKKEDPIVAILVEKLRNLLRLKNIKVVDQDFHGNFPGDEVNRCFVIVFGTVKYFNDLKCLEELKLIRESNAYRIMPIWHNKCGDMIRFVHKYLSRRLLRRPLLLPLNIKWPGNGVEEGDQDEDDNMGIEACIKPNPIPNPIPEKGDEYDSDEEEDDNSSDCDEDGSSSSSFCSDEDGNVYEEDLLEEIIDDKPELTIGQFFLETEMRTTVISVTPETSLEDQFDEINVFALSVWTILNPAGLDYTNKVGLKPHLDTLRPCFAPVRVSKDGVAMGGRTCIIIGGPPGSGKSTILKFLYNNLGIGRNHFHHTLFIESIALFSKKDLFFEICKGDFSPSSAYLVCFEDINTSKDATFIRSILTKMPKNESRVIVASRDAECVRRVLEEKSIPCFIYNVPELNYSLSWELFSLKAFGQGHPPKDYMNVALSAVHCAKGNPAKLSSYASLVGRMYNNGDHTNENMAKLLSYASLVGRMYNNDDDLGNVAGNYFESFFDKYQSSVQGNNVISSGSESENDDDSKRMSSSSVALLHIKRRKGFRHYIRGITERVSSTEKGYLEDRDYKLPITAIYDPRSLCNVAT